MVPSLRIRKLHWCIFVVLVYNVVTHVPEWEACSDGNMTMEVGSGEEVYLFNKSSPVQVPPGTVCSIQILAKPMTVIFLTVTAQNIENKKLQIFYDEMDLRGTSFVWGDHRNYSVIGVGNKYTVLINIPSEAPAASVMLKIHGEPVMKNIVPIELERHPIEILPKQINEKYTTIVAEDNYRIGLLVDCYMKISFGKLDPRIITHLRHIIFFSDQKYLVNAELVYEFHKGVYLTNRTAITMVNTHDESMVTVIAFPYEETKYAHYKKYSFADWRRGVFMLDPGNPGGSAAVVVGKVDPYKGALDKITWGSSDKLNVFDDVAIVDMDLEEEDVVASVDRENGTELAPHISLPHLLYTFQSNGSVEFELSHEVPPMETQDQLQEKSAFSISLCSIHVFLTVFVIVYQ